MMQGDDEMKDLAVVLFCRFGDRKMFDEVVMNKTGTSEYMELLPWLEKMARHIIKKREG